MVKNHCLAKSIQDVSWGEFFRTLEWQCKKKGKYLVKINRFFPSSKLCSNCGYKKSNKELTLKDRVYHCPECGNKIDRDFNASLNILRQGLSDFKPAEKA